MSLSPRTFSLAVCAAGASPLRLAQIAGQVHEYNNISKDKRREFGKIGGKLGGNRNNVVNAKRKLAAAKLCEECSHCHRLLLRGEFWPGDWRKRRPRGIMCKECCPVTPTKRATAAASQQRAIKAAESQITCKVCQQALPRSSFRPNSRENFDVSKGLTCEKCRADRKLPRGGRKRQHSDK